MNIKIITSKQFASIFNLRPNQLAWFLGAGASAASGIPTGYTMIRDFKAQIFCQKTNLSKKEIDISDPIWIDRIDAFFQKTSLLPPAGDPIEYAAAFEAVYPEARHRRQYIDDAISKGTPCFGHKVLGSLIAIGQIDCVFTTNFDPLIEESTLSANTKLAVDSRHRPTVAAIDSADRATRCLSESDWPLIAKLHGDYQSIAIKNTETELEAQDIRMRNVLMQSGERYGMIFVGYSGRDESIMDALNKVLESVKPFPNGLYWLTPSIAQMLPAVKEFLSRAQMIGVDVAVIECSTFDELAADIIKSSNLPLPLIDWVMQGRLTPRLVSVQLPTTEARKYPILRYSSLLIESMPNTARRIRLVQKITSPVARELLREKRIKAIVAANGQELAVFGNDEEIIEALAPLGAKLDGIVKLDPIADSWAKGLLYDALVRSLVRHLPLIPRYKRVCHSIVIALPRNKDNLEHVRRNEQILADLRAAYQSPLSGAVPNTEYQFQEGISLRLDLINERWWLGFEPYTFVQIPRLLEIQSGNLPHVKASDGPIEAHFDKGGDPTGDWRRERWAQRYNKNWANIIAAWARLLTHNNTKRTFGIEDDKGIDAIFKVSPVTGWSRPGHDHVYFNRTI